MTKRRMVSLDIIDTDLVLEMPITSQLLYFHLAMRVELKAAEKSRLCFSCMSDDSIE